MNIINMLDDLVFGPMNLINRVEGWFNLLLANDRGFRFSISRSTDLKQVQSILAKYGVKSFGATHDSKNFYFTVKQRQASWAEYLMLRSGIKPTGAMFDTRNILRASKYNSMPTAWVDKKGKKK